MPDTLLGFVDAMNGIPDNTSNLVSPQDCRQSWLSLTGDLGSASLDDAQAPVTIPIAAANTWTDIPSAIGTPAMVQSTTLFWRMDLNGHLYYDYAADWPGTVAPAGYLRAVTFECAFTADLAGNNDLYEFTFTLDGVPIGPVYQADEASGAEVGRFLIAGELLEVNAAPLVSVAVQNTDSAADLDLSAFAYLTRGGPTA